MLEDVRLYAAELAAPVDLVPDVRTVAAPFGPRLKQWVELDPDDHVHRRDYVAARLPSGSNGNKTGTGPLSGSRHAPIPISPDRIDVLGPTRQGSRGPQVRGVLGVDNDQVGHLSLATTLETWIRDWCERRDQGEGGPVMRVDQMCQWLYNRLDWACSEHPAIDEFADEIRSYRSTMVGLLGLIEKVDYKDGIACPKCNERALFQRAGGVRDGSLWIECGRCPAILSPVEYAEHTEALQAKAIKATVIVIAKTMAAASKAK